jgi:hypothetical protein
MVLPAFLLVPFDFSENLCHHVSVEAAVELLRHPLVETLVQCGVLHDAVTIKPDVDAEALFEQLCRLLARDPTQLAIDPVLQRAPSDCGFRLASTLCELGLLTKFSRDRIHTD